MKLIVASNNAHKIKEIKQILGDRFFPILSLREAGIDLDVEETGDTFLENAILKAKAVQTLCKGSAVLSDDSGIEVDALGLAPGVYSARYSGQGDEGNNQKLLAELSGLQGKQRSAHYVCIVVLLDGEKQTVGEGKCYGEILEEYRGDGGFGYDPLFFSYDLGKTFAEATPQEKNKVSHRSLALLDLLSKV